MGELNERVKWMGTYIGHILDIYWSVQQIYSWKVRKRGKIKLESIYDSIYDSIISDNMWMGVSGNEWMCDGLETRKEWIIK